MNGEGITKGKFLYKNNKSGLNRPLASSFLYSVTFFLYSSPYICEMDGY